MQIKEITFEMGNDFHAVMECEHCGHTRRNKSGYNDAYYHEHVIPAMKCVACGKSTMSTTTPKKLLDELRLAFTAAGETDGDVLTAVDQEYQAIREEALRRAAGGLGRKYQTFKLRAYDNPLVQRRLCTALVNKLKCEGIDAASNGSYDEVHFSWM